MPGWKGKLEQRGRLVARARVWMGYDLFLVRDRGLGMADAAEEMVE